MPKLSNLPLCVFPYSNVVEHEYLRRIQYQSNLSLYWLYYAEVCYECVGLIPASLRPGNPAPFEEMLATPRPI